MNGARILAFVLAGGEGRRLHPLTSDRPEPAVELGEGLCLIDFALANLVNSGVSWIYLRAGRQAARVLARYRHAAGPRRSAARRLCGTEPAAGSSQPSVAAAAGLGGAAAARAPHDPAGIRDRAAMSEAERLLAARLQPLLHAGEGRSG